MIVITGATGQLGRLVITELLKTHPASELIAAVRSLEKAQDLAALGVTLRQADYNLPATLDTAFQGAEKVLLISSSELGQRIEQHRAVIAAAKRANVKLLAYTSLLHADTSPLGLGVDHRATEALLQESGLPVVILRNGWYSENYTVSIPTALAHQTLAGCAGDGRIASASRADYAAAAAVVLSTDTQAGKVYELAGDEAYTLTDMAAEISQQSGTTVKYLNLPQADYQALLLQAGLPEPVAALLADSDSGAAKGGLFDDSRQLSKLIGRPTQPLSHAVANALNAG
ncbi:SDR family oxidoreductase [Acerihabitans sp. TG2]|uniref:SDR family oxidoreductase n=1 Tax=Acerihabitans sp. TG2 TaxID=3096008 RepID=UPI002B22A0A4|nr:SDR family oxidoreductase [Acerihabitans sp. TG2]MEA9389579.1 SDR family oxidoreductase [Acerihabitans sp. TG2]